MQLALGGITPPERLMVPAPAVAVPPHDEARLPGVATIIPAGRVSTKPTPISAAMLLGFAIVKLTVVVPPGTNLLGAKLLLMTGGAITVRLAFEVLLLPSGEVAVTELFFTPAVIPVTFTVKLQLVPGASIAPDRLIIDAAAVAVMVPPPQAPVSPFGDATINPAGRLSMNPAPVRVFEVFGFVIVKLRPVLPFKGIVGAPKLFVMVGGAPLWS